jgi:hypothetical protein
VLLIFAAITDRVPTQDVRAPHEADEDYGIALEPAEKFGRYGSGEARYRLRILFVVGISAEAGIEANPIPSSGAFSVCAGSWISRHNRCPRTESMTNVGQLSNDFNELSISVIDTSALSLSAKSPGGEFNCLWGSV